MPFVKSIGAASAGALRLLLPAMFAVCALVLQAPPRLLADPSFVTVTSTDGLNLRSAPNTQAGVEAVIPYGSVLNVTGSATLDGWYPVSFGSLSGWADGAYLTVGTVNPVSAQTAPALAAAPAAASLNSVSASAVPAPPSPPQAPASSVPAAPPALSGAAIPAGTTATTSMSVTTAGGLNLRSASDTNGIVLTVMPQGAVVQVTGPATASNWYPVVYGGIQGWADGAYLSPGTGTNAPSQPPAAGSASTAGLTAATFGNPPLGHPAPPESGLSPISAPPTVLGMFIWPVAGPHNITTVFQPVHQAIDIDQYPSGDKPVSAIADGIVTYAGGQACCSYGLYVIIQHANGFSSLYAHFSKIEVSVGQIVKQGQEIGRSGCTGFCSGPHVHFAVYYLGQPLDPLSVLSSGDVTIEPGAQYALIDPSLRPS